MAGTRIVIPLYPDITHLDFTGPHQVLVRIPDCEVVVASLDGADIAVDGLTFAHLADLAAVDRCDVLCIPGGQGTTQAMLDEHFMAEIRRLGADAAWLTSVCTGSLILGAAGFLRGRKASTHWAARHLLPLFGAVVSEDRVTRDGNLITGGGVTAGIDFAFTLAEELRGRAVAEGIQLGLEYAPSPPFDAGRPSAEMLARIVAMANAGGSERDQAASLAAARMREMS